MNKFPVAASQSTAVDGASAAFKAGGAITIPATTQSSIYAGANTVSITSP